MEKKCAVTTYQDFKLLIDSYFEGDNRQKVAQALDYANEHLSGITRYDGSPIIEHSISTACIVLQEIGLGTNSTISTLLHDVVRRGFITAEQAGEIFGEQCVEILKGLSNISDVEIRMSKEQADNYRDLIVSYSTDPRVLLIKLADRLEVMRSLDMFPEEKRLKKSWETMRLYSQIAHKLGLYAIKSEMEDISLKYLEPEAFNEITQKLSASAGERENMIAEFVRPVEERLREVGIKYTIKSRTKTIHSIWTKMRKASLPFEEIYDIFAIRVIIDCPREKEKQLCWAVYSIITDFYTPNPERLRDWISIPKSNGYESLHTTVVTKDGKWVEVQIRSERMDEVAEHGIAAHWRYKGVHHSAMGSEQWLAKLRELMEHHDPQSFEKKFGHTTSTGEIFVFTPNGDLRKLPEGATILDFAFDIHTDIGTTCVGGKVNHKNVSIREVLHNGDIVEVVTSKNQRPKPGWLNIVVTGKARNKIRAYLREEQSSAAGLGREELERKIKNWKIPLTIDDAVNVLCRYYKIRTGSEFYSSLAEQKIPILDVKDVLQRYNAGENFTNTVLRNQDPHKICDPNSSDCLVIDDQIKNIEYKFAKCCNPIRGDQIFGFVTVNSGITIHRQSCPNAARLKEKYPYRLIDAQWRQSRAGEYFRVSLHIVTDNKQGVLNRITELLTNRLKLNLGSISISPDSRGNMSGIINIEVPDVETIDRAMNDMRKTEGVVEVFRADK